MQHVPRTRACFGLLLGLVPLLAVAPVAAQTSQVGQWQGPFAWPLVVSHAALLANGRVLVWNDVAGTTPRIWDPATSTFTNATTISTTVAAAGQSILKDGKVAFAGGVAANAGLADVHSYDAGTTSWTLLPSLAQVRIDAAGVVFGDARLLVLGGETKPGSAADVPEYLVPGGAGWTRLTGAARALPRRPWVFALSSGKALLAGPDRSARLLDLGGTGSWTALQDMLFGSRDGGTAVLMPGTTDRVMTIGGHNPAIESCELLDVPTTSSWTYTGSMARARRNHNATLLADGTVLVTGGTLVDDALWSSVYSAERYTPGTGAWSTLASMTVPRRRGSIALLLPDGRVLCAGGGDGTTGSETHADAEIYSPPYLFLGTRPVVDAAPASVAYGTNFDIGTQQAASTAKVWLLRGGATSASFNSEQRAVSLPFTIGTGKVTATAPASGNAAPPGTYILFVVNSSGVPSVGRVLQLAAAVPQPIQPSITSSPDPSGFLNAPYNYPAIASGSAPITWSLTTAPSWLHVSPSTGAVGGVPAAVGNYSVVLRATNSGGFTTQSWTLQVTNGTPPPQSVVAVGATWRYFKGSADPGSTWATLGFNDNGWLSGPSAFGYGDPGLSTILSDMPNSYTTVYTRNTFSLFNVASVGEIDIDFDYDDGFAVFLNGTRIMARNAPATILNTSTATSSHDALGSMERQAFTDAATRSLLREGSNVLAVVGLNVLKTSSDLTLKVAMMVSGGTGGPSDVSSGPNGTWLGAQPNPFRTGTTLAFTMSRAGAARIEIYDVTGVRRRTLGASRLSAGRQTLIWDGRDDAGRWLHPGVYFYRLRAGDTVRTGKLTRAR